MIFSSVGFGAPISRKDFKHFIVQWEGYRRAAYQDGQYIVVGIGHNLTAHKKSTYIGECYSPLQIEAFYNDDYDRALKSARQYINNFDDLNIEAQKVVLSVIWTVGPTGFSKFRKFHLCLKSKMYNLAATALRESFWFEQVGRVRANHHYLTLRKL